MNLARAEVKARTLIVIVCMFLSGLGSNAVADCLHQEITQNVSGVAASSGCPHQVTDLQATNQKHSIAVPVYFEQVIVPTAPKDQMALFELQNDPGPMFWIEDLIKSQHKENTPLSNIGRYGAYHPDPIRIFDGKTVKGRLDLQTGEAVLYPTLAKADPTTSEDINLLWDTARRLLTSSDFIAHDETTINVDPQARILMGAAKVLERDGTTKNKPSAAYLGYFLAWRKIGEYSVYGTASKASIVLNGRGEIVGLSRLWRRAVRTEPSVHAVRTPQEVLDAVRNQLERYPGDTNRIDVSNIELAYYDGNTRYLQPVYRFTAAIHHLGTGNRGSQVRDDSVIGYLPYAKEALEPLPRLGGESDTSPTYAPEVAVHPAREKEDARFVGRYVTAAWQPSDWIDDAQEFFTKLSSPADSTFKDSQYYWAEPRLFTKDKKSFINAVDVALFEGDGDWWMFGTSTNDCGGSLQSWCDLQKCCKSAHNCCSTSNCCSSRMPGAACCQSLFNPVNINGDITSPGYGERAGGNLKTWIIHSCEVIPTPEDTAYWATPWWPVFGGLRSVVGYRTPMKNPDQAGGDYGQRLRMRDPIVGAWLQDVIGLSEYSDRACTLAHGGISRHWGLPSAISSCGHEDDSLFSTSADGSDSCLSVWWFSDENQAGPLCKQN